MKKVLAVHGLDGKIAEAITYYQDEHTLVGGADFVMANPPFNVDGVDKEKLAGDKRFRPTDTADEGTKKCTQPFRHWL